MDSLRFENGLTQTRLLCGATTYGTVAKSSSSARRRRRMNLAFFAAITMGAMLAISSSRASANPTVSVSNVAVSPTSPFSGAGPAVCRPNNPITVSATVNASFDSDSSTGPTSSCSTGNNIDGVSGAKSKLTVQTVAISYSNEGITASAADNKGDSTAGSQTGPGTTLSYSDSLSVPSNDGTVAVTVSAQASETQTTVTTTTTTYYTTNGANKCTGTPISAAGGTTTDSKSVPVTSTKKSAGTTYVADEQPPTMLVQAYSPGPPGICSVTTTTSCATDADCPNGETCLNIPQVQQGSDLDVDVKFNDGSSGTPFTIKLSASDGNPPDDLASMISDNFGGPSGANDDGKAPPKTNTLTLHTECSTPVGTYSVEAEGDTQDLCGNSFDPIGPNPAQTDPCGKGIDPNTGLTQCGNDKTGTFQVTPGVQLEDQTGVVSQLTNGDYGIDQCFASAQANRKVVNTPGSVHITSILTSTGPCASLTTLTDPVITLTLPPGFKFDKTGGSPLAHVFVGSGTGFDLHSGAPLTEITSPSVSISSPSTDLAGNISITVSLTGSFPADGTIYVRAHAIYSAPSPASSNQTFTFSTSATTGSDAGQLSNSSSYSIVANPTTGTCNADGLII